MTSLYELLIKSIIKNKVSLNPSYQKKPIKMCSIHKIKLSLCFDVFSELNWTLIFMDLLNYWLENYNRKKNVF